MAAVILAADAGGTKTHLGLYKAAGGSLELIRSSRYPSADFPSLEGVCAKFLGGSAKIDAACFGVPGPVIDGRAHPTNLPWTISESNLSTAIGGAPVTLINDLCATAYGAIHLPSEEIVVLHPARNPPAHGNIAVIAAGTGLGEAALVWESGSYHAVASEGGHSDFAPQGDEQIELLRYLEAEFGHVSWERLLSGKGLANIHSFLRKRSDEPEPPWLSEQFGEGDPAAAISVAALSNRDPVCVRALTMFCEIYGAEAANLALKVLALGGVYLGGGVAPKILPMLQKGAFVKAFMAKGRLEPLLERIEVRVALNPAAALLGAAHRAAEML
ncbi:MAG TPA: glucokinase [Candidatus Binataceae bacterium]|nr:glucokinase [Candidatus Binataceae bacterium]